MAKRRLGTSRYYVTPVGLGCWPMAGMTSLGVNDKDSLATIESALDSGINFLDTAYCYGANGESDQLISKILPRCRDRVVLASKAGIHWDCHGVRHFDASPQRILQQCDESLARLGVDIIDLFYLHAPDPNVPVERSAEAFNTLLERGKVGCVGVSNLSVTQLEAFHQICPVAAIQPPYNMLQRQIEEELIPWCLKHTVAIAVYWPLMKGLLAGRLRRDHTFDPRDQRQDFPMYQDQEWEANQKFLDELEKIAEAANVTIAQLVIHWTIRQPGITAALCGAKRDWQIKETAAAMGLDLDQQLMDRIDRAIETRQAIELSSVRR